MSQLHDPFIGRGRRFEIYGKCRGHKSSKTTEIYIDVSRIAKSKIQSFLVHLELDEK